MSSPTPPEKICRTCGRPFAWRAKWKDTWERVEYCSADCKGGPSRLSLALEQQLSTIATARGRSKTACPSEAVIALYGEKALWPKDAMRHARYAVNRLAARGVIEVRQQGRRVDASSAKGPIRIQLR